MFGRQGELTCAPRFDAWSAPVPCGDSPCWVRPESGSRVWRESSCPRSARMPTPSPNVVRHLVRAWPSSRCETRWSRRPVSWDGAGCIGCWWTTTTDSTSRPRSLRRSDRAEPESVPVLFRRSVVSSRPLRPVVPLSCCSRTFIGPSQPSSISWTTSYGRRLSRFSCCAWPSRPRRATARWESTDVVELEPLSTADVESLVVDRAGSIRPDVVRRIVEMSEGNPLFAEQLLVALDDGPVGAVPASLSRLLTMRLDRLGPGERDLLRCASVVGLRVRRGCYVRASSPRRPSVPRAPSRVNGAEALHPAHRPERLPVRSCLDPDGGLSEHRSRGSGRAARAVRGLARPHVASLDTEFHEVLGYHLEQAMDHRRASGIGRAVGAPRSQARAVASRSRRPADA